MDQLFRYPLHQIPLVAMAIIIALSVHEFAHAYVAYKFGDDTAKRQGRLTLSPMSHLDPIGMIAVLILGFGWARPVPVNPYNFKRPRLAGILVSIAGPISNFLLAAIGLIIWYALIRIGVLTAIPFAVADTLGQFFEIFIVLNVVLLVFNLLPIPPLDGYRVMEDLAPANIRAKMTQYEKYGAIALLILVITPLDRYTIQPIFSVVIPQVLRFLENIIAPIFGLI
ncbi:site-2 protease family protein [Bacillus cytotoxicus]|uniref:Peptidase M50 n=1 Tax=Bacillus cytotoxicus (strain DSM 22905 / CIP 110041 / 391-98 / NVH 391-98) TaxID=315749 RepID=A7GVC4_BACCN|nr:site-2 protease family protein [Bacillus cytotoxicus]ABS24082.1 peptidase M50 [Bacillus cytotoxicus NVH 391-98]AWC34710.1 site-2 protease family protein [Bacillus cytotoxicus]AWC38702.1 site-2 protease family protein [Bacillus cytotoxicus]AWC46679.1 site-2 protease family protein [Bacillus cytotoxicus]AWC62921.1 site-2 protease family protein [Bacillus cytotoxicus]